MVRRSLCIGAVCSILLAACETPTTPYQPMNREGGYAEQLVEDGTWRVQFAGNTVTDRDTVENYLLYRAAEVADAAACDRFMVLNKDVEPQTRYRGVGYGSPFMYGGFDRFHRRHGYGFAYYGPADYYPTTRYTAYATIRCVPPDQPVPATAEVYRTDALLTRLNPMVRRPSTG